MGRLFSYLCFSFSIYGHKTRVGRNQSLSVIKRFVGEEYEKSCTNNDSLKDEKGQLAFVNLISHEAEGQKVSSRSGCRVSSHLLLGLKATPSNLFLVVTVQLVNRPEDVERKNEADRDIIWSSKVFTKQVQSFTV